MPDMIGNRTGTNPIEPANQEEAGLSGTFLFVILLGAFLGLMWLIVFILLIIK